MKSNIKKETSEKVNSPEGKKIDRKEAIKKGGYIAAATMLILLSANKAQAQTSAAPPPAWPGGL